MIHTDILIIGAGQAGLAMSRCLGELGIAHLVVERGRIGERWRSERWASLRLLSPRWQTRLPGHTYDGPDPDGYMSRDEVVAFLETYARGSRAPVLEHTTVTAVARAGAGYRVSTSRGDVQVRGVVIASGHCDRPLMPDCARNLSLDIDQVSTCDYKHPAQLRRGGVLVVGASATGVQLAEEIHRSGRPVTLAVGRHIRMPRCYRRRDVMWWLDRMGIYDERADQVPCIEAARRQPSMQLVGRPDRGDLDLGVLQAQGVRLAGRLAAIADTRVRFADDLAVSMTAADNKMRALLARIDAFAEAENLAAEAPAYSPLPVPVPKTPLALDLHAAGIATVLWATGFRRHYPWLSLPILDEAGEIRHQGGITPAPGVVVLGLPFQCRRKSMFVDGVGDDARVLAAHLQHHLRRDTARAVA